MIRTLAMLIAAAIIATGAMVAASQPAQATVTHCGDGRCTVYLSQSETKALGAGRIPRVGSVAGRLVPVFYASARIHIWIAKQYGRSNKCSAFTLNIRPWATQGYYGYTCNWR